MSLGAGDRLVFDPDHSELVVPAPGDGPGHWAGAPSVVEESPNGRVFLGYRCRRPRDGSADERGYLAVIAESSDGGENFHPVWSLSKHEVGTSSLERFCLRRAPAGGWLLYTSWEDPPASGHWRVDVMAAEKPDGFNLSDCQPVFTYSTYSALALDAVKDPYVPLVPSPEGAAPIFMFVSVFLGPVGPAPTGVATSSDGLSFTWSGIALGVGPSWDAYQARLSSVVVVGDRYFGYYDGAGSRDEDTEERAGLAESDDLLHWRSVSPAGPLFTSRYGRGSLRYVEAVTINGAPWAYFEHTRSDGAHELRRARLSDA